MRATMREESVPPGMAGAWHVDAHSLRLPVFLSAPQLVSAAFNLKLHALIPGEVLRTVAGRFQVETLREEPSCSQVVLLTEAPGLSARLGITATESSEGEGSVVLHTSVHPRSRIGRAYFRLIEPFHHMLMEWFVLPRLQRRARRVRPDVRRR